MNRISGVVADGKLVALSHTVVTKSIALRWAPVIIKNGVDRTALYGADDIPYAIPNFRVAFVDHQHAIPVGFMRAPGANINTFVSETFLDQLAHTAGKDPVAFRLALLEKAPRAAAVLQLAASKANWGQRSRESIKALRWCSGTVRSPR